MPVRSIIMWLVISTSLPIACRGNENVEWVPNHVTDATSDSRQQTGSDHPSSDISHPAQDTERRLDTALTTEDASVVDLSDATGTCNCQDQEACIETMCLPIICAPGESECVTVLQRKVCNDTGTGWVTQACVDDTVCSAGDCTSPTCDPLSDPSCVDGQVATCIDGVQMQLSPCPGGSGCLNGQCIAITPNIVLVVDTSGSMSYLWDQPDVWPDDCTQNCPPWNYPDCDDPTAPKTRLGRTKVALNAMLSDEITSDVRLALMRFPQRLRATASCQSGHYTGLGAMTGDDGSHQAGEWFTEFLWQVMMVPFRQDTAANDTDAMLQWFDFTEALGVDGNACISDLNCAQLLCDQNACATHTDPELRGVGPTPLGKSLFYAGEYLRREVLIEGKACVENVDCASPHHTCIEGTCSDPFHACRPTKIVLFTDGQETVFTDKEDYFHPIVQAKRMHFGLGCTADIQCSNGASCTPSGQCEPPAGLVPETICDALPMSCETDADCPAWNCGEDVPCPGTCLNVALQVTDPEQQNYLKDYNNLPIPLTIHVVDASAGTQTDNALIAAYGGGQHVSVSLGDINALTSVLLELLDPKDGPTCVTK
ncbi:MAG: hypothetical protein VX223_13855 [Myxococcota bacterium]|nr:hypothetical protein [Myxococcota bacterium]